MSEVRQAPRIDLAMTQKPMAPHSRWNDLLAVTLALSVLLMTAIVAVFLTLRMLMPKSALAISAGDDYADALVLNGPPRIQFAEAAPAPAAMPTLRIVPALAPKPKRRPKRQSRHVALARADLYLPPLRHSTPDMSAPSEYWIAHGSFRSKASCEKFRRDVIDDTIMAREADPDREIYNVRIRLLMAGRCEDEQDQ